MCTAVVFVAACVLLAGGATVSSELCSSNSVPQIRFCPGDSYCCGETGCCPKMLYSSELSIMYTTGLVMIGLLLCCILKRKAEMWVAYCCRRVGNAAIARGPPPPFSSAITIEDEDPPPPYDTAIKMAPPDYDRIVFSLQPVPPLAVSEDPGAMEESRLEGVEEDKGGEEGEGASAPNPATGPPELSTAPVADSPDSAPGAAQN